MAANPETAVTVIPSDAIDSWEPRTLEILADYPAERFNVLVPTVSLRQVNPYLVPDIEAVKLDPNPENGDIYHDSQMKAGMFAPTKPGLRKLAQVAGITTISSQRVDDGRDPDYVEWQVEIEMVQPSGRPIRGFGTKQVDLRAHMVKNKTPEWVAKAHEHMVANAESKALNRAIRSILSLRPSYPQAQLAKPFAILRYVPDMTHPEVRARFLDMVAPVSAQLYGPGPTEAPKQVGPGADDGLDRAPAVTDDEDAGDTAEGDPREVGAATDEPAWMSPAAGTDPARTLVERLQAAATGSKLKGPMTEEQTVNLGDLLRPVRSILGSVIRAAWGDDATSTLSAAQAAAIFEIAKGFESDEAFHAAWTEASEATKVAAA